MDLYQLLHDALFEILVFVEDLVQIERQAKPSNSLIDNDLCFTLSLFSHSSTNDVLLKVDRFVVLARSL